VPTAPSTPTATIPEGFSPVFAGGESSGGLGTLLTFGAIPAGIISGGDPGGGGGGPIGLPTFGLGGGTAPTANAGGSPAIDPPVPIWLGEIPG